MGPFGAYFRGSLRLLDKAAELLKLFQRILNKLNGNLFYFKSLLKCAKYLNFNSRVTYKIHCSLKLKVVSNQSSQIFFNFFEFNKTKFFVKFSKICVFLITNSSQILLSVF